MVIHMNRKNLRSTLAALLCAGTLALAGCAGQSDPATQGRLGLGLADTALAGGAPKLALGVSRAVLARDPRNVPALVRQGDAYHQLGDDARAAASYRQALTLAPRNPGALIGLGRVALASDPAEASARFSEVLALEPSNEVALTDRGIAADLSGLHAEAQADYRRAISLARDGLTDEDSEHLATAQVDYAVSLAISGQAGEAVRLLRPIATAGNATPRVRQDYAMALTLDGRESEAAQVLVGDMNPADARRALAGYAALGAGVGRTPPTPNGFN
jgi:Flp pilus assembly protein TadD